MGWADYSLQSTPRNRSPVDSGVDVRMDADERDDVPRNDSIFSISSCDSAEDVELSHVLSQRGAESRYTFGTQRQYNSSEEMLVIRPAKGTNSTGKKTRPSKNVFLPPYFR